MTVRGALVAVLLAVGLARAPAAAQEQDTVPPEQPIPADTSGEAKGETPAPAYAPSRWAVTITLGTLAFDALQTQPVLAERLDGLGTVLDSATLARTVRVEGGLQATVSGGISLDRSWAVQFGIGAARTTLGARFSGDAELFVLSASRLAEPLDTRAWLIIAETGIRYRIPATTRFRPYLELGGTALFWRPDTSPALPELEDVHRTATYAAVGAVVPLMAAWRAEVRVVRRLSRTPVSAIEPRDVGPSSSTLRLTTRPAGTGRYADESRELISGLRFDVGLTVGFGALPPQDRPGTAAPPSPSVP